LRVKFLPCSDDRVWHVITMYYEVVVSVEHVCLFHFQLVVGVGDDCFSSFLECSSSSLRSVFFACS
jgi:hypothetical protein